jgi:hypothetical protein
MHSKLILAYVLNSRQKHAEAEPLLREVLPVHETISRVPYHCGRWPSIWNNWESPLRAHDSEAEAFRRSSKTGPKNTSVPNRLSNASPKRKNPPNKYSIGDLRSKSLTFFIVLRATGLAHPRQGGRLEKRTKLPRSKADVGVSRRLSSVLIFRLAPERGRDSSLCLSRA